MRENNSTTPEIETESPLFVTNKQNAELRLGLNSYSDLVASHPEIVKDIVDKIDQLNRITHNNSPYHLLRYQANCEDTLTRASAGIESTLEQNDRVRRISYDRDFIKFAMWTYDSMFGILEQHEDKGANEDITDEEQQARLRDPLLAKTAAYAELDLFETIIADKPKYSDEVISSIFNAVSDTLLSGNKSLYTIMSKRFNVLAGNFEQSPGEYKVILDAIKNKPEQLHELLALFDDDEYLVHRVLYRRALIVSENYLELLKDNAAEIRNSMLEMYAHLAQPQVFEAITKVISRADAAHETPSEQTEQLEKFTPMQLNWEVLPPGKLAEVAREIVGEAEGTSPTVDLERLNILENIREHWGTDNCYYSRGVRKVRRVIRGDKGEEQADEYIILVLQEHDEYGEVMAEHAVAESPIAGPNALYVQRQNVNGFSWRDIMALSKKDARELGARQVKHTKVQGENLVMTMTEKVKALLSCDSEDFEELEFGGNRNGKLRIRLPKVVLQIAPSK